MSQTLKFYICITYICFYDQKYILSRRKKNDFFHSFFHKIYFSCSSRTILAILSDTVKASQDYFTVKSELTGKKGDIMRDHHVLFSTIRDHKSLPTMRNRSLSPVITTVKAVAESSLRIRKLLCYSTSD